MEVGSPGATWGAAGIATADFSVASKNQSPVMWAGRLGWPLILALVDQPFKSSSHTSPLCRRTTDRAHAADLHACAEPFDDPAWLSNSSSPSLSAGEWDKPPLPAHSPIFLSNLPLLRHVQNLPSRRGQVLMPLVGPGVLGNGRQGFDAGTRDGQRGSRPCSASVQ